MFCDQLFDIRRWSHFGLPGEVKGRNSWFGLRRGDFCIHCSATRHMTLLARREADATYDEAQRVSEEPLFDGEVGDAPTHDLWGRVYSQALQEERQRRFADWYSAQPSWFHTEVEPVPTYQVDDFIRVPQHSECVICLEECFTISAFSCGHGCCTDCLLALLAGGHKCPCCRAPLAPADDAVLDMSRYLHVAHDEDNEVIIVSDTEEPDSFDKAAIALKSESTKPRRPRGVRAGRRVKQKQDGYCYLRFYKRSDRTKAAELGKWPTIQQLVDFGVTEDLSLLSYRLAVMDAGGRYHVQISKLGHTFYQMRFLYHAKPQAKIGGLLWTDLEDEPIADEFLRYHTINADTAAPSAEIIEEAPVTVKNVKLGGDTDCWKKIISAEFGLGYGFWLADPAKAKEEKRIVSKNAQPLSFDEFMEVIWAPDRLIPTIRIHKSKIQERMPARIKNWWVKIIKVAEDMLHLEDAVEKEVEGYENLYAIWQLHSAGTYLSKFDFGKTITPRTQPMERSSSMSTEMTVPDDSSSIKIGAPKKSTYDVANACFTVPEVRRNNEGLLAPRMAYAAKDIKEICPWAVPPENQSYAEEMAIPWSESMAERHPHPLHNAVRRMVCKRELAKHINGPCTFVSMSQANRAWVEESLVAKGLDAEANRAMNPVVDIKDLGRYLSNPGDLPMAVFTLDRITTPYVVFHDSGHYMKEGFLIKLMRENPEIKVVIFTSVYPLERLRVNHSLRPTLYDWVDCKETGTMVYIPEGADGDKYEQPMDPGLLLCRSVEDETGKWRVTGSIVWSKLNHHIQVWSCFNLVVPRYATVHLPTMMKMPRLLRGMPKDLCEISRQDYVRMFEYGKALPSITEKDAWAKLRQMADADVQYLPVGDRCWLVKVVMEAIKIDAVTDLQSKAYSSLSGEIYYKTIGHLVRLKHESFEARYAKRHRALINEPYQRSRLILADARVHMSEHKHEYGVEWRIPEESQPVFLTQIAYYWCLLTGMGNLSKPNLSFDGQGRVVWNRAAALTKRNVMTIGLNVIKEAQRKEIRALAGLVDPIRRVVLHPRRVPPRPDFMGLGPEVVEESDDDQSVSYAEGRNWGSPRSLPHRSLTASSVTSGSSDSGESDSWPSRVEVEPEEVFNIPSRPMSPLRSSLRSLDRRLADFVHAEPEFEAPVPVQIPNAADVVEELNSLPSVAESVSSAQLVDHCDRCPTIRHWVVTEGTIGSNAMATQAMYDAHCEGLHNMREARREGLVRPMMQEMAERARIRTTAQRARLADLRAAEMYPDPDRIPVPVHESEAEVPVPILQPLAQRAVGANVTRVNKEYDEAVEEWNKLMRKKPKSSGMVHNYSGKILWDVIFKQSVDGRFSSVPYLNVVSYPTIPYPRNDCLLKAVADSMGMSRAQVLFKALVAFPGGVDVSDLLPMEILDPIGLALGVGFVIYENRRILKRFGSSTGQPIRLIKTGNHIEASRRREPMSLSKIRVPIRSGMGANATKLLTLISDLPTVKWFDWKPEPTRASLYARAMYAKETGLLGMNPANDALLRSWDELSSLAPEAIENRKFCMIRGDPGCRKSSALQKILRNKQYHRDNAFAVVLPTSTLAQDWKNKLGVQTKDPLTGKGTPSSYVCTFEKCLTEQSWGWVMIFDEDKFPKGYMSLVALIFPWVKYFIFLSDEYQSEWFEPNTKCLLNDVTILGNASFYQQYSDTYLIGSWRFGPGIANFMRMPSFSKHQGGFHFCTEPPKNADELRPYFPHDTDVELQDKWDNAEMFYAAHARKAWATEMTQREATTFSGSQGLTAPLAIIEVDAAVLKLTDYRLIHTVLSRAQDVLIVCVYRQGGLDLAHLQAHAIWSQLMKYRESYYPGKKVVIRPDWTYDIRELRGELGEQHRKMLAGPPSKVTNKDFLAGWKTFDWDNNYIDPDQRLNMVGHKGLKYSDPAYADAAFFRPYIEDFEEPEPPEPLFRDVSLPGAKIRTHVGPVPEGGLSERFTSDIIERFDAELSWKSIYSVQKPDLWMRRFDAVEKRTSLIKSMFPDLPKRKASLAMNKYLATLDVQDNPLMFNPNIELNWGQNQLSSDGPSFAAGVAQRIRRGTYLENKQELKDQAGYGEALWGAFCRLMGWGTEETKSIAPFDIEAAKRKFQVRRNDRSQALKKASLNRADPDRVDVLTAKTQWKMKDLGPTVAKPLQTIMIRGDDYLFKLGWVGVYLLDCLLRDAPPNVYFHAQRSLADFQSWAATYMRSGPYEMNDIKGLDASVRGGAVVLMTRLMRRYGIPQELIDFYVEDKADFKTRTIHIAFMTLSGELFTWLLNTVFTVAREALKFALPFGTVIAGSGDDVARKKIQSVAESWHEWEEFDAAEDKRYSDERAEFCSFKIKNGVVYKDPLILYKRLRGQIARGKMDDVALGYFDLFAQNYKLGDVIYEVMTPDEIEATSAINRIMFNLKKEGYKGSLPWHKLQVDELETVHNSRREASSLLESLDTLWKTLDTPITDVDIVTWYTQRKVDIDYGF